MNNNTNAVPLVYWTGVEDWSMNFSAFQFQDQLKIDLGLGEEDPVIFTVVSYDQGKSEWNVCFDLYNQDGFTIPTTTFDSYDQAKAWAWEKFVELPDGILPV
jgi:hypothetical protein